MANGKKTKSTSGGPGAALARQIAVHGLIAVILIVGAGVLVKYLRQQVARQYAFTGGPPRVVLINRPAWMSEILAKQILQTAKPVGAHSAFDHQLLVDTAQELAANPWVREVRQIRRVYGNAPGDTLEVDCDYRVPTALVKWQDYFWLVDGEGFKLPEQYTRSQASKVMLGPDHKLSLRIIEGVAHAPVEYGNHWPGDDLAAGLELAKVLAGRPYAEEIPVIDVSNFGGRRDAREAQIVLQTRYGTQVRWGLPPGSKDYFVEVPVEQKLNCMKQVFDQIGRVDGGQPWIDIRFDRVTYPTPEARTARSEGP
jgi:hypothetical protein